MDEVEMLTLAEAATLLAMDETKLEDEARAGQLPIGFAEDGSLEFRRKDVEFYAFRLPPPRCIGANRAAREGTRPKKQAAETKQ